VTSTDDTETKHHDTPAIKILSSLRHCQRLRKMLLWNLHAKKASGSWSFPIATTRRWLNTSENLSRGNRNKAHEYHQEMRNMGAAPSANTFGLYIVSLKDSHQTHDEASDAVQIFKMAMQEGVQPTSFLFNAVIGKLSKARRVDDCLNLFIRMRLLGIKPTSVTFGTMINALRVGDENLAVELFNEMEAQPNYKPRPAPYNGIMQFYVNTKHDRSKALEFYERMLNAKLDPTSHTYKLLIEAYATLEEPDLEGAERIIIQMEEARIPIEAVHHAVLIHAKGCVFHDVEAAIKNFDNLINTGRLRPDATLYQALIEVLVGNHRVAETDQWVKHMNEHPTPPTKVFPKIRRPTSTHQGREI
jgi:pentatricopeptide repeat protein